MSLLLENFDFVRPTSLEHLNDLVKDYQEKGHEFTFSAGGTALIPKLKTQSFKIDKFISLNGLKDLHNVKKEGFYITIGALTTLSTIANHELTRIYLPALAHATRKVASPQIRNRATIGGNIMVDNRCIYINQSSINRECHSPCFKADGDVCHLVKSARRGDEVLCQARFVSDTAPILLLLNTKITIAGPKGPRKIKLGDLYLNDGIDSKSIEPGEVITTLEVEIPENTGLHYEKLAIRNALDFPSLGVAVRITDKDLSVALTGVNTRPGVFRANLDDYNTFDDMVSNISKQAADFGKTYNQDFFPRAYRKSMIPVFIRRGVNSILKDQT
ncbi:MAG: hypothetical protein COB49_03200 [Alphaproteobacteria bacterium]|nr:MAG: hypothetical protein COB49_03200 [Alphaproteobacteria bacterium]